MSENKNQQPQYLIDQVGPDFMKPHVQLVGQDGNAFYIIGKVRRALTRIGRTDLADEYSHRATQGDYHDLLTLVDDYCETDFEEED